MTKSKKTISIFAVLLAAALWGTAGIFVRNVEGSLTEMQLVFGRALISTILIGGIMLIKDKSLFKIKLKDIWLFVCLGLFSIVAFNFCYYKTMSLASLSVAAVLLYTAPFFVIIISALFFKEKITLRKTVSLFVAFVGCLFVSGFLESGGKVSGKAIVFGLLTGLGYGLYTVFGGMLIRKGYSTFTINFYAFLVAALVCLPIIGLNGFKTICYSGNKLLIVLGMALFNTVIPYLLYSFGLKTINGSNALIMATLEPVVATLVGTFIFGEDITVYGVIGIALVLLAVIILNIGASDKISLKANAKINLSLYITGKREDGYHTLDGIMQSVSLFDKVTVKKQKNIAVFCKGLDIAETDNIAYKAANLFFEKAKINGGALITVKKNIPAVAGLGGGSADAAAVLVGLNKLYGDIVSDAELLKIAVKLGADVPFFIKGGTARAEGIGEKLTQIDANPTLYFVIAKADTKPSTKEMYERLDNSPYLKPKTEKLITALKQNDFEGITENTENCFGLLYKNSEILKFSKAHNLPCSLSGSGPCFFMSFNNKKEAKAVIKKLKAEGITALLAKPLKSSITE